MSSPRRDFSIVWPGGPSWQGPHRVGAFSLCPQMEGFAHELHLRPIIEGPYTAIGTLLHAALAYRYAQFLNPKPHWYVYPDGETAIRVLARNEDYRDKALRMYEEYQRVYSYNVWTPVLVEEQLVVKFSNGEPYTARVDLMAWEGKDLCLIDHKTVGRLTTSIGMRYRADRQMLTGLALARANGHNVTRVIINAVTREANPQCKRFNIDINQTAYERIGRDTEYWLEQMRLARIARPDPKDRPRNWEACMNKEYGQCDFYGLCTGTAGAHEYHVPEEYVKGRLNADSNR